jgi:dethiobiotin synthetase
VGKTQIASAVVRALVGEGKRVGVLKPVATGAIRDGDDWRSEDAERLTEAAGVDAPIDRVSQRLFEEPLAPCVAARRAGRPLSRADVERAVQDALEWWKERVDVMVVEGVGGWLCPLAEETTVADLAVALDYPVLVVARLGLGTLNHTLLTVEAIHSRSVRVAGVVFNSAEPESGSLAEATNPEELARRLSGVPILGVRPFDPKFALPDPVLSVDWYDRVKPARHLSPD